jgi:hypothetical protein
MKHKQSQFVLQKWRKTDYSSWKSDRLLLFQEGSVAFWEREDICRNR